MAIGKHTFGFTLLLAGLGMLPALSIDMNLPALTSIAASLHTSDALATMTLSLFLLGFAGAPLICGPLSDRYGRRPLLVSGSIIYAIAAFTCFLSPCIEVLLGARLFQGFGAGICGVLIMAVIRDLFEGDEARSRLSYISVVRSFAPMIAPSIGVAILSVASWRSIFLLLAGAGTLVCTAILLGFEESSKKGSANRSEQAITASSLAYNYGKILRHPISCGYAVVNALLFGAIFAYVSNSPLVFVENMHLPRSAFACIFALTSFGLMIGFSINGQLSKRGISHRIPLATGLYLATAASFLNVVLNHSANASIYSLVGLIFCCVFSMGLVSPNATHACLEPMQKNAGAASAVLSFLQMMVGSASSAIVAHYYDHQSPSAMTSVMSAFTIASTAVYLFVVRPAEKRRRTDIAASTALTEAEA